ncbi:MAG: CoA transferase [Dehalococcoidia bacterium]|nr:CoA transferase [Dehalococcoidia bacterium]
MTPPRRRPLDGIRVLDATQAVAGPVCAGHLAALGAEVIKIERPGDGDFARRSPPYGGAGGVAMVRQQPDDISTPVLKRNRDKLSLALDMGRPEGLEVLQRLVSTADVFLENLRPGVTEKLHIGYESLKAHKPDLIYCSISGFGRSGPYKDWAAFDTMIQAMSGLMAMTGYEDGPPTRAGILVADNFAPLFAGIAVLAALRQRDATGEGQFIEVSLFDCLVSLVWDEPIELLATQGKPARMGNRLSRSAPWNTYPATDGDVMICAPQQDHWKRLTQLMGRPDLLEDPRFTTLELRIKNVVPLDEAVAAWTRQRPRATIVDACQAAHIACGPVNDLEDLVNDPQVQARGLLQPLLHPAHGPVPGAGAPAYPVRFSGFPAGFSRAAPAVGQDTDAVLARAGFSLEQIANLRTLGIV